VCAFLVGTASCLSELVLATLNGSGALLPHMMSLLPFLSLQSNLCLPQMNYHQVNLLHFRRWTQTARYFLSTERIPLPSLLEQESSALLPSLLVSFVTQVVLQSLLPRLSLLFLQEIVRHGSNITQLQHLPEAANFQRHISPPHPPQLKAAFVQPPQASSAKLPRDQC
jgi:hypothetical protein